MDCDYLNVPCSSRPTNTRSCLGLPEGKCPGKMWVHAQSNVPRDDVMEQAYPPLPEPEGPWTEEWKKLTHNRPKIPACCGECTWRHYARALPDRHIPCHCGLADGIYIENIHIRHPECPKAMKPSLGESS